VIYDALKLFNIGPTFIKWVHTIYNETEACVTNNGFSSPFFKLQRGVRQGCPLSAYLFIMVVELLAHKIRKSEDIIGIKVGETEIKLVQMADDTTVFVEDQNSLDNIFKLLRLFEQYAGLKLNKNKTEAMWVGKDINNQTTPLEIKWVKQVHSLGVFFSYDTDSVVLKNFMDRAKEFKRVLDMWLQRNLSLIGKIAVLKSLAFSKIIYQCGVITIPPNFIQHINDIAFKFLWHNKPAKIKGKTIISDYNKGGLRMLDVESFLKAQKVMWVKRLLEPGTASWKAIPILHLKEFFGLDTFKCNMSCLERPKDFPDFYWQVIRFWNEIKDITREIESPFTVRRECIWLNKNIILENVTIPWREWSEKGINIIHDILDENGDFLSTTAITQKNNFNIDFLKYNALKNIIPPSWRRILKTMKVPQNAINFREQIYLKIGKNTKRVSQITNKEIYWIFVQKIQVNPIILTRLQEYIDPTCESIENIFMIPKVIRDTKIRTFQYKLLYNLIPCNQYLKKINRSDSDKCNRCHFIDTTIHYFYECHEVQVFWDNFKLWWDLLPYEDMKIKNRNIMLGIIGNEEQNSLLNSCILLAKWHIYKNKLDDSEIIFYKFLCDLKYYLIIEKTIDLRNNNYHKYLNKWQILEDTLAQI
jgi:hypothetical protein